MSQVIAATEITFRKFHKTNLMKAILLSLTFIALLASCKKEEDETNNHAAAPVSPVFTGIIDDTSFTADYYNNSYPNPLLQLYAYETPSNHSVTLTLENKNTGTHTMTTAFNGTSASCQAGGGTGYYSMHGQGHGSINVTSSSANSISGNFSFTGYNFAGTDSVVVTGQFSNMAF